VDAVDLVDDVAQQVAADHAVLHALEDVGDDLALAALWRPHLARLRKVGE
jgi:hypothetical protein